MNSRLLNIPAILVAVLTISIGSFIYNSSQSTITDAMDSLSTQEKEAFNSLFTMYEGKQTGSNIKALMGSLIGNAETYRDEPNKVPYVYIDQLSQTLIESKEAIYDESMDIEDYIDVLGTIRNRVEAKHEYHVKITYQENTGLVDYIQISFDLLNPIEEEKHR